MKQRIYAARRQGAAIGQGVELSGMPSFVQGQDGGKRILDAAISSGFVVNEILGREYRASREAEAQDLALNVSRQFDVWRAQYEQENQGRLGLDALRDYSEKYDELARNARASFSAGNDGIFGPMLERKLTERGLFAVREGLNFSARQREIWLASQLAAQEEDFLSYAAQNPQDEDGIAFRGQQVAQAMSQLRPGRNLSAPLAELSRKSWDARMTALEAQGDLDGMERLLNYEMQASSRPLSIRSPIGHWAAAYNNPGCVTTNGTDMAMFATPAEGIAAIMERAQAYAAKGHDTPARIMMLYAPPEENDTKKYIAHICRAIGKGPNEKVDARDPAFLKAFARAICQKENSLTIDDALLEAGWQYLAQNGKPKFAGQIPKDMTARASFIAARPDPARLMRYQKAIEAGRKQRQNDALEASMLTWSRNILALPGKEQAGAIEEICESVPEDQKEAVRTALFDLLFRHDRQDARGERLKAEEREAREREHEDQMVQFVAESPGEERSGLIERLTEGPRTAENLRLRNALFSRIRQLEEQENASWQQQWQNRFDQELAKVADALPGQQNASLDRLIQEYARSGQDADSMRQYGESFFKRIRKSQEVREDALIERLQPLRDQGNLPALHAALAEARQKGIISQEGLRRANDLLFGPAAAETRENMDAMRSARVLISNGGLQTGESRRQYAQTHKLTIAQEKELMAFQGYASNSLFSRIQQAARRYGYTDLTPREADAIATLFPTDHEATDRDIDKILAAVSSKKSTWFGGDALDVLTADNPDFSDWLPDVSSHETARLDAWLKAHGYRVSSHNRSVLKKRMLAPVLKIEANEEFDELTSLAGGWQLLKKVFFPQTPFLQKLLIALRGVAACA